jgi:hypothetical protein
MDYKTEDYDDSNPKHTGISSYDTPAQEVVGQKRSRNDDDNTHIDRTQGPGAQHSTILPSKPEEVSNSSVELLTICLPPTPTGFITSTIAPCSGGLRSARNKTNLFNYFHWFNDVSVSHVHVTHCCYLFLSIVTHLRHRFIMSSLPYSYPNRHVETDTNGKWNIDVYIAYWSRCYESTVTYDFTNPKRSRDGRHLYWRLALGERTFTPSSAMKARSDHKPNQF